VIPRLIPLEAPAPIPARFLLAVYTNLSYCDQAADC
jgi:hypothetical protein